METKMKRSLKVLAFVMAVFMFIGAVPAFAVDDLSEDIEVEKKQVILDLNSVSIEEEIVEKRGENVKHFKLNNDTCIAVQYAQPIHYLDANGNWVEYADDYSIFNGNSNIESYLYYFGIANTRIYENNDSIIASIGNATNQSAITISLPFANSAANGSRSNIDEEIDISNNEETDDIGREIETTDAALSSEESESEDDSLSREDNEELSDYAAENDPNGEETTGFVDENDEVQDDQEEVTEELIPEDTDFEDPASETTEIDELESESTESADLEPEVTENEPFEEITDEENTTNDENVYDKNIEIIESAVKKATRSYIDVVNGLTAEIISFSNGFTYKLSADNGSFPEYVVSVNDGRLIAVDDGGIEFFDGNGKAVFKIIAPYAYDSDGKVYDELDFELFSIGNDKYELTINSTDNLLNSAAMLTYVFSVITVDDSDESLVEVSSEDDINVDYSKGLLCVGSDGLGQIERSILTYSSLPELDKYDIMLSTLFNMYINSGANNSSLEDLSFNNVSEAWDANTTWYSRPNVTGKQLFTAEKEISGAFCYDRAELVSVDVTKTVRDWYDEKENYGVYISNNDETKASKTLIYTSFSEVNYHPYTIINYLSGSMLGSGEETDPGINQGIISGQSGEGENPRSMDPMPGGGGGSNNTFEEITGVTKEYYNGTSWQTISNLAGVSDRIEGVKLQTSNQPYYFVYRSRSNERGWEDYVSSNNSGPYDFAGYFGYAMTNLEIQVFEGNDRIYDNYVIMFRAKVAGEWLDWVSNGSAEIMSTIKSEYQLNGGLDTVSVEAGWASLGSIQALQIRMFKRKSYTPPTITETESGAFAVATGIGKSYRPLSTYTWTSFSSDITSNCTNGIDGVKLQTSGKPYHFYYRVRDSYHGWLDDVDSRTTSGDDSFAGWGSYPIYNLEINVRDSSNNN